MKLKNNKKWIIAGAALIIVVTAAAINITNSGEAVESMVIDKGEVAKLLKETGFVESESSVIITAKNSGEIKGLVVEEGDSVNAGDLLITSIGTSVKLDIKSMKAELAGLQARYSLASELASKNRSLYEQGALSYADYNISNTEAKQLAAQITALQYSIDSYAEASGAEGVTASADGVLTGVFVREGEFIAPGSPLLEISNLSDIYVKADFIASDADLIRTGDAVRIYNKDVSFNDENATVKKVHLKAEDKMSDLGVNQKRVTVEISFGTDKPVRLGSNVDLEVIVEKKMNVLRVSDLAVFEMNQKNCVYVIEGGKAILREIETGLEGEDYMEVISGLSEGETVILSPGGDISDGVRIKEMKE